MKTSIKTTIAALALSVFTAGFSTASFAAQKPYCTVASNNGAAWWTWTVSTQAEACRIAKNKLKTNGNSVNWKWRSHYSDNSSNNGLLVCHRDSSGYLSNPQTKLVEAKGARVFRKALGISKRKNWSACYFRIIK